MEYLSYLTVRHTMDGYEEGNIWRTTKSNALIIASCEGRMDIVRQAIDEDKKTWCAILCSTRDELISMMPDVIEDWGKALEEAKTLEIAKAIYPKYMMHRIPQFEAKMFFNICSRGNIEIVRYVNFTNWNEGLHGACSGGHLELVRMLMLNNITDWRNALFHACYGGNIDIIQIVAQYTQAWDYGLRGACMAGRIDIAKMMLSNGVRASLAFNIACTYGQIEIVRMLSGDYNTGLHIACIHGHLEVARLMLELGAVDDGAFRYACYCGHLDIAKLLMPYNKPNKGLYGAIEGERLDVMKYLYANGADDWLAGIKCAYGCGDALYARQLISRVDPASIDYSNILYAVCKNGHVECIDDVLPHVKRCSHALEIAIMNGHVECVEAILKKRKLRGHNYTIWKRYPAMICTLAKYVPIHKIRQFDCEADNIASRSIFHILE